MAVDRLSFKNRNSGRQPRANGLLRLARVLRRKRVAYERAIVWDTMKLLSRQIARMEAAAKRHDVPLAAMDPLPALPTLPTNEWVEFKQAIGATKPVVKPTPTEPQQAGATA